MSISTNKEKEAWDTYIKQELNAVLPILKNLGFTLEDKQPHVSGERYLNQFLNPLETGKKLILVGSRKSDNRRAIIKLSRDSVGAKELHRERNNRLVMEKIDFAYRIFLSPPEILFIEKDGFTISITEFIEQERTFLERSLEEQFFFTLKAFEALEGSHATTYEHASTIRSKFGIMSADEYLKRFEIYKKDIYLHDPENTKLKLVLIKAEEILTQNRENIEQYCGFLTHFDFVPHNFRISLRDIYLLDHSSLHFGNKYEGWARLLNFMTLYNPALEKALIDYVQNNRGEEEFMSLKLMRIYRLTELLWCHTNTLEHTHGDLHILNEKRVELWTNVFESLINDSPISKDMIEKYKQSRDKLRSAEETERQKGLH
jgi:hypothetical protein